MSTVEITLRWIERASDWANPILVKETRQALKSKQFVSTFMLLLTASWLVSVFGLLLAGDEIDYGAAGREFFVVFYLVLSFAILVIVPFGAFRSLLTERDENTYELLSISTLSPRQIVWGKLSSALLQVFIFYSGIAPFIAFTSLLRGFDIAQAAFLLVVALLLSLILSMIALMASTFGRQRPAQALVSGVFLIGVMMGFFMFVTMMFGMITIGGSIPFDDADFWWGVGWVLLGGSSYFILFLLITTAQLTFESDNRSTGIRLTCSAQFWLLWLAFFAYFYYSASVPATDELKAMAIISAVHWAVVGLFAATEGNDLSRRIRRRLPRWRWLRLFMTPLLPGGDRGFLYLLLHVVALWGIVAGAIVIQARSAFSLSSSAAATLQFVTGLCCYVVIFIGIATVLARLGRLLSSEIRPAHVRMITLLLFVMGMVVPALVILAMGYVDWRGYSLIHIANPFITLAEFDGHFPRGTIVLAILTAAAGLCVLINLRSISRAVGEVVFAKGNEQSSANRRETLSHAT